GWDFDDNGAPGSVPKEYYIQTTFIHRSEDKTETQRTRPFSFPKVAFQISCVEDSEHYRCADFQRDASYHYLVVEDSSNGAAVYSLERRLNEKSAGATEMALLDALSRHSPHSLTIYASPEADKQVGFVRALSEKELQAVGKPPILEAEISGEGLAAVEHSLTSYASENEFNEALKANKYVFVLFWSHVHSISLHTFNLWARTSKKANFGKDVVLAHVECHRHADFCHGLDRKDFYTVVAYRNGDNIASTYYLRDESFYLQWIHILTTGPLIELETSEAIKSAKKGRLFDSSPHPVTIGTFPDREGSAFQHFSIAADRLHGRYFMAVVIKSGANPTVSTYRPSEKQRRRDYEGHFDPASLMAFVSTSSFPTVIDISRGFTTNLLFRQPRKVAVLIAPPSFTNTSYVTLASRRDVRRSVIFTYLNSEIDAAAEIVKQFAKEFIGKPHILLLDKLLYHQLPLDASTSSEEMLEWIQSKSDESAGELSIRDPHPLRLLQKAQIDGIFGEQNTLILPDDTLYQDLIVKPNIPTHPPVGAAASGGCPFMGGGGGGGAIHEEL
ncbi:unnamed protein product, partial [Nippostrongylus brasiliensis]|uniref:PKD domain-containing protein n=1 Tax=Nippostrongylus brasiliensis TaxID=27835 RepID=A0A0N4XEN4_NIPBR